MKTTLTSIACLIASMSMCFCHAENTNTGTEPQSEIQEARDRYFQPTRFGNGMSVSLRMKGASDQAFDCASNVLRSAGMRITKLDRHLHLIQGVPADPEGSLAEIRTISIQQIGFMPRPDLHYVEWHISLFLKDGIRKSKTDPAFASDPKVTETLRGVLVGLFDALAKEMTPMPGGMPRPE